MLDGIQHILTPPAKGPFKHFWFAEQCHPRGDEHAYSLRCNEAPKVAKAVARNECENPAIGCRRWLVAHPEAFRYEMQRARVLLGQDCSPQAGERLNRNGAYAMAGCGSHESRCPARSLAKPRLRARGPIHSAEP